MSFFNLIQILCKTWLKKWHEGEKNWNSKLNFFYEYWTGTCYFFFWLLYILVKVKTCKKKLDILSAVFFLVQNVITFSTFLCGKTNQKWQSCHFLLFFSKMLQKSGTNIFYKRNIQDKNSLDVKVTPHKILEHKYFSILNSRIFNVLQHVYWWEENNRQIPSANVFLTGRAWVARLASEISAHHQKKLFLNGWDSN